MLAFFHARPPQHSHTKRKITLLLWRSGVNTQPRAVAVQPNTAIDYPYNPASSISGPTICQGGMTALCGSCVARPSYVPARLYGASPTACQGRLLCPRPPRNGRIGRARAFQESPLCSAERVLTFHAPNRMRRSPVFYFLPVPRYTAPSILGHFRPFSLLRVRPYHPDRRELRAEAVNYSTCHLTQAATKAAPKAATPAPHSLCLWRCGCCLAPHLL